MRNMDTVYDAAVQTALEESDGDFVTARRILIRARSQSVCSSKSFWDMALARLESRQRQETEQ